MANKTEKNKIIDPVCGMDITGLKDIAEFSHKGKVFYFCGAPCESRFKENPEKFQGEPLIKMRDVKKYFGLGEAKIKVLRGLTFNIWEGDFIALIGASGSGKSTALNMIGLLDRPSSGEIFLKGKNVSFLSNEKRAETRSEIFGFVFQQYNLVPWLTAYENAGLPLIFAGKNIESIQTELKSKFSEIGLGERMDHRPFELSGGEQQRVALLRALTNNPEIILGDEPTGNLDSKTGAKILDILINLNKKKGKTLIIVTHDMDIAEKADQIIVLKDGKMERDHHIYKKIYTE